MAKKRKKKPRTREFKTHTWQESLSLGTGLLFLSILAFVSRSYEGGSIVFFIGLYFLIHGSQLRKGKKATFEKWVSFKTIQSLIMIGLGVIMMNSLPANFFGVSFLITLIGLGMFIFMKLRYYPRPYFDEKKSAYKKRIIQPRFTKKAIRK